MRERKLSRRQRLLARLARIRADLTWVHEETVFVNLESYRHDAVKAELRQIAAVWESAVIAGCEAIGNNLPQIPDYTLIYVDQDENRSRSNIFAYVRDDLPRVRARWVDLEGTWPRTSGPGTHEARSYLVLAVGRMQQIVAHQPPKSAGRDVWKLQWEGINALVRVMAPWTRREPRRARLWVAQTIARLRPRLLVWDANRRSGEAGPGPDALAAQIGGEVHGGHRIDHALSRGTIKVRKVSKHARVGGLKIDTDHGGCIRVRWSVRSYWLKPTQEK